MARPFVVKNGNWFKNDWGLKAEDPDKEGNGCEPVHSLEDKWRLMDLFLQYKGIVTQHIDSYNHFVTQGIRSFLSDDRNSKIKCDEDDDWFLKYDDVYMGKPIVYDDMGNEEKNPQMCRLQDMTYNAPIYADIRYWNGKAVCRAKKIEIGYLPVMLRSILCALHGKSDEEMQKLGECPYDPGGYFIVKGVERVVMMNEQLLANRIIVETDMKKKAQAFVQSSTTTDRSRTVVCSHPARGKKGLYLKHSVFKSLIPVAIIMKGMGVQSDMEFFQMVGIENHFLTSLIPCLQEVHEHGIFSQQSALAYLDSKLQSFDARGSARHRDRMDALSVLQRKVLSHIPIEDRNFAPKIRYLGLMIRRVIATNTDPKLIDDRDYYGNKRLELTGQLLQYLFEDQFQSMNMDLRKQIEISLKKRSQLSRTRQEDFATYPDVCEKIGNMGPRLTDAMVHAIATGNLKIKRYRIDQAGCSQVLSRLSYMAGIGHMMRVISQFKKKLKMVGPRALQPSHMGMLCPCDTPEGEQCGLVKHLALLTHVTTGESEAALRQVCYCLGVEDAHALSGEEMHHKGNYLVFLNGTILGVHRRPRKFMANLKGLRRCGRVGEYVSIYEHEGWNAVIIASDGGRLCRPLIIVQNEKPLFNPQKHVPLMIKKPEQGGMTFADFLKQGVLEWVDVNEENNLLIALSPDEIQRETTHLEIEPLTFLGVVSALIPYPHHNQAPRNTYECAMGKQAMGCVAMNQYNRSDTLLPGLVYPQRPLCTSKTLNLINFHHLGAGENASVAVMSYSGYDIEDAIVMNRASLDRGFGRCFVMRRTKVEMSRYEDNKEDRLFKPNPEMFNNSRKGGMNKTQILKYSALDADGLCRVGEKVESDFILANRRVASELQEGGVMSMPREVKYKEPVSSYIDRVIATQDNGKTMYKVLTRQTRRPEIGDKFASRHGQKGVIGLIAPEEDLPFSETGWRPDLIMNPHGFPSRMTVGKLLECIGSKAAVMEGIFANGSAFGGTPAKEIYRTLVKHGFAPSGKEYLTSGITGEALEAYIFCGPIYYQKLKHMVVDKIHARAGGPIVTLTRQPVEGRAKDGGLKVGEMERDCFVAYGASNLLLERLMLSSDACNPTVCRKCGLFSGRPHWCKFCQTGEHIAVVRMPYACKLLFQELQAMNVCCRLNISER